MQTFNLPPPSTPTIQKAKHGLEESHFPGRPGGHLHPLYPNLKVSPTSVGAHGPRQHPVAHWRVL